MSEHQIQQILKAFEEQKRVFQKHIEEQTKLDEARLAASWKVYEALQSANKQLEQSQVISNKKIDDLASAVAPILKFIQDASGAKKFGILTVKITLGLSAALIALGTIGVYSKKILLFIIK